MLIINTRYEHTPRTGSNRDDTTSNNYREFNAKTSASSRVGGWFVLDRTSNCRTHPSTKSSKINTRSSRNCERRLIGIAEGFRPTANGGIVVLQYPFCVLSERRLRRRALALYRDYYDARRALTAAAVTGISTADVNSRFWS